MSPKIEQSVIQLLQAGSVDFVEINELIQIARNCADQTDDESVRTVALSILETVLTRKMMKIGDLTKTSFRPWDILLKTRLYASDANGTR